MLTVISKAYQGYQDPYKTDFQVCLELYKNKEMKECRESPLENGWLDNQCHRGNITQLAEHSSMLPRVSLCEARTDCLLDFKIECQISPGTWKIKHLKSTSQPTAQQSPWRGKERFVRNRFEENGLAQQHESVVHVCAEIQPWNESFRRDGLKNTGTELHKIEMRQTENCTKFTKSKAEAYQRKLSRIRDDYKGNADSREAFEKLKGIIAVGNIWTKVQEEAIFGRVEAEHEVPQKVESELSTQMEIDSPIDEVSDSPLAENVTLPKIRCRRLTNSPMTWETEYVTPIQAQNTDQTFSETHCAMAEGDRDSTRRCESHSSQRLSSCERQRRYYNQVKTKRPELYRARLQQKAVASKKYRYTLYASGNVKRIMEWRRKARLRAQAYRQRLKLKGSGRFAPKEKKSCKQRISKSKSTAVSCEELKKKRELDRLRKKRELDRLRKQKERANWSEEKRNEARMKSRENYRKKKLTGNVVTRKKRKEAKKPQPEGWTVEKFMQSFLLLQSESSDDPRKTSEVELGVPTLTECTPIPKVELNEAALQIREQPVIGSCDSASQKDEVINKLRESMSVTIDEDVCKARFTTGLEAGDKVVTNNEVTFPISADGNQSKIDRPSLLESFRHDHVYSVNVPERQVLVHELQTSSGRQHQDNSPFVQLENDLTAGLYDEPCDDSRDYDHRTQSEEMFMEGSHDNSTSASLSNFNTRWATLVGKEARYPVQKGSMNKKQGFPKHRRPTGPEISDQRRASEKEDSGKGSLTEAEIFIVRGMPERKISEENMSTAEEISEDERELVIDTLADESQTALELHGNKRLSRKNGLQAGVEDSTAERLTLKQILEEGRDFNGEVPDHEVGLLPGREATEIEGHIQSDMWQKENQAEREHRLKSLNLDHPYSENNSTGVKRILRASRDLRKVINALPEDRSSRRAVLLLLCACEGIKVNFD